MAEAVEVAIEFALLAHLSDFGTTNSITVAYPNVAFTPPIPTPSAKYLRGTFLPADTIGLGINSDSYNQHYGLFQVDVFHGPGGGIAAARTAASLIAHFKRMTVVTKDGFKALVWKPPYRGQLIKDDAWSFIPVRVPFLCLANNPT